LWFSPTTPGSVLRRIAAELDQAGLVGMQFQSELRETFSKIVEELLGFISMLKAQDEVVSKTDDDHVAARRLSPSLDPEVEHVVKVDVSQQRADTSALNRTHLALRSLPILQHAGVEPFLDQPHHAPVRDTLLDEPD